MFAQITQSNADGGQTTGEGLAAGAQGAGAQGVVQQTAEYGNQMYELFAPSVPKLIGAFAILIIGWIVAVVVAIVLRALLRRTGFDKKLAQWCGGDSAQAPKVERGITKGIYYLIIVLVLVAFFDTLGLTQVTQSLNGLLGEFLSYLPRLVGAGALLLIAWIAATVLRFLVQRVASAMKLDERLQSQVTEEEEKPVGLSKTMANMVYWLVFLLFLPAILSALALPGLLEPVQIMVGKILGFLPNLFAAGLILAIGWFVARIIQRITTNLLAGIGTDSLSKRVGITNVLGEKKLSGVLGLIVYILILLPVLVASLNALQLEAVTAPASEMLNIILSALPSIFAAAVVIILAYVVGRVVAGLCAGLLADLGFNKLPFKLGLNKQEEPPEGQWTVSQVVGTLILVATMLFAVMQALPIMGFDLLAGMISQFLFFAGHIVVGLIIFAIGLYLANLATQVVRASQLSQADLLALVSRVSIILLAGAMALRQMGLANEIITSAFTIILGATGVAFALAFGLGGREAAGQALNRFFESRQMHMAGGPRQAAANPQKSKNPAAPIDMPQQPGSPPVGSP